MPDCTEPHAGASRPQTGLADAAPPGMRALVDHGLRVARGTAAERAAFHAGYLSVAGDPGIDAIEVVTELRRVVLLAEASLDAGEPLPDPDHLAESVSRFQDRITVIARVRFHPHNVYTALPSLDVRLGTGFSMQTALEIRSEPIAGGDHAPFEHRPVVGAVVEATFRGASERAIQTFVMHVANVYLMVATLDLSRMP